MSHEQPPEWWIFRGTDEPHDEISARLPEPPPWRQFTAAARDQRGARFRAGPKEKELVNAALYLRRPLLVTGKPGVGKTSLAYAVARELSLGKPLRWSITTRTTLEDGLYRYDAIARLQEASFHGDQTGPPSIDKFLRLGPLGTAFADSARHPRLLLIDEIDKSDIDLPNDLLHIFEEGEFPIPELERLPEDHPPVYLQPHAGDKGTPGIRVHRGRVSCKHFPLIIMTSNGERDFPAPFLRRCLQLEMEPPLKGELEAIVRAHLETQDAFEDHWPLVDTLINDFLSQRSQDDLAADQLLNAVYLALKDVDIEGRFPNKDVLAKALWRSLSQ